MDHHPGTIAREDVLLDHLLRLSQQMKSGDRLVLSMEQVNEVIACVAEADNAPAAPRPPLFYFEKPANFYLNPRAVAFIGFDKDGQALVQTVNGALIRVEALQWQLMQQDFREGFQILTVRSTGGLVSA